ncbi:50S ribosomal protein L2 [Candidatus Woesearchaeota archaeon]|nr:50S ribosomal protein L2 [Candidatus Woesearchaeota archaeon]
MGKNLIQQARGKGSTTYRAPSFRYKGKISLPLPQNKLICGSVKDILNCPGHDAPLINVKYENGDECLLSAPENICVGELVSFGPGAEVKPGNVLVLKELPEGTFIYNIEQKPNDGGKYCRTTGSNGRVIMKTDQGVVVQLPSKKEIILNPQCRAVVGKIAGGGKKEKPFLKAGLRYHAMKARNKLYPRSRACAMNAVDHPFGNKRSARKAKQKVVGHFAPPGRKVGKLWARRTGRKK